MVFRLGNSNRNTGMMLASLPALILAAGIAEAGPRSPAPVVFGDPVTVVDRTEPAARATSTSSSGLAAQTAAPVTADPVVAEEPRKIIFRGPSADALAAPSDSGSDLMAEDASIIEPLESEARGQGPIDLTPDSASENPTPVNEVGLVGIYPEGFEGQPTSNGEIFQSILMTASHPTLPLPSLVRVSNPANGYETVVRVNDRGPFGGNRIMELSQRAGETLGLSGSDSAVLHLRYLGPAPVKELAPEQITPVVPNVITASADSLSSGTPQDLGGGTVFGDSASVYEGDGYYGAEPTTKTLATAETDGLTGGMTNGVEDSLGVSTPVTSPVPLSAEPALPSRTVVASSMHEFQPAESAALETVIASGYYVQAGSFYELKNAQRQIERLGQGLPVRIQQARVNNADFFRVLYGPFPSWDAASAQRATIEQSGAAETIIISR